MINFGEIDIFELLQQTNGDVSVQLIDAGMIRDQSKSYSFSLDPDNEGLMFLEPVESRPQKRIHVLRKIPISIDLLVFFGMYDGDGNKTGNIGFAQNNTELQTFISQEIEKIFPSAFESRINILESSKFFEDVKISKIIDGIIEKSAKKGKKLTLIEAQKVFLIEEFEQTDFKVNNVEDIRITISPKKGGLVSGKRSYEIIVEKDKSRKFLTFLLYLIKETIDNVLGIKSTPGINIAIDQNYTIDMKKYIESDLCKYPTVSGRTTNYAIVEDRPSELFLSKRGGSARIRVRKYMDITPMLCLMFGIYWAEGTTTKKKLFMFREISQSNINIGFNSSENKSLKIFLESLKNIFPELNQVVGCWLVKIGAKYHAECNALGSKLGLEVVRGGPGGDGIARTFEITRICKEWAIAQFPVLSDFESLFNHIEFTGAGIPRVDIRCKPTAAYLFFSLMVDISFNADNLLRDFCQEG